LLLSNSPGWRSGASFLFLLALVAIPARARASSSVDPGFQLPAQPLPPDDSVFFVGEELTYNVSFGPIDIGQVRIKLVNRQAGGQDPYYKATAHIDSYKGVPLVNLHAVYENHIGEPIHSAWFHSKKKDGDRYVTDEYTYQYDRHRVLIEEGTAGSSRIDRRDTLRLDTLFQDGLSLFFLARTEVLTNREMTIPTIVSEKKGTTTIRFSSDRVAERIEAVDYPIDLVHFEGTAGFVGLIGLTGGFEGWFTNDAARVPVIAKMKVVLGNIRIELMKWKRGGWVPPRAPGGPEK
jgi:hypothetical protein